MLSFAQPLARQHCQFRTADTPREWHNLQISKISENEETSQSPAVNAWGTVVLQQYTVLIIKLGKAYVKIIKN